MTLQFQTPPTIPPTAITGLQTHHTRIKYLQTTPQHHSFTITVLFAKHLLAFGVELGKHILANRLQQL